LKPVAAIEIFILMKRNNVLRATIREILMENYNVSIVATPIITKKRKRGEAQLDDIIANVVLGEKELADFIELANSKDLVNTAASEASDEIMSRIRSIEERVGPGAAKLAMSVYLSIKDDPSILERSIFNLPDENGSAKITSPDIGDVYDIPIELQQLALTDKSAGGSDNIGKGEALGILMFGRSGDGKEPDLIVSTSDRDKQFSVKYFRSSSDTVRFSAGLAEHAEDTDELVSLTKKLRDLIGVKENFITRSKMRSIIVRAIEEYSSEEEGMPPREDILEMANRCGTLWDTLTVSTHPVLCLCGGGGGLKFKVASPDPTEPSGIRLGVVRLEGNIPKLEIASPDRSQINVAYGSAQLRSDSPE
jgi:hypothetical protein